MVANYAVAAEWYKKAAEQNYPEAQMALADLYNYGKLDRNYNEAVKWYSRAATNGSGNVKAMGMLGSLYHDNHENFPHDHAQSARWFRMAAEKGDTGAGYELALLLLDGEIPHNQPEAETLLKKAADEGNANAAIRLAGLHHETPQSALKQFSREELNARAVNGNGAIVLQAATADEEGRGGPIDVRGAAGLYLRILMYAPDDGKTEAINRLVNLYYSDKLKLEKPSAGPPADFGSWSDAAQLFFWSGPKNEKQLAEIFQRSRKFASPLTQYHVGEMYYRGEPVAQDKGLAVDWFKSAAEAGNPEAMNRIGEFWASGAGGQQDVKEAAGWYRRAAEKGSGPGELNLGRALGKSGGSGAKRDRSVGMARSGRGAEKSRQRVRKRMPFRQSFRRKKKRRRKRARRNWRNKSVRMGRNERGETRDWRPHCARRHGYFRKSVSWRAWEAKGGWKRRYGHMAPCSLHPGHSAGTASTCQSKKSWLRTWLWTGPVGR